jgi:hypothetical protein
VTRESPGIGLAGGPGDLGLGGGWPDATVELKRLMLWPNNQNEVFDTFFASTKS